ncbi:hypothetical protein GCM10010468_36690 [Actinocorallia longicatena]|uniref:Regulatory protein n=2 Tax=Actinocorallia longicatena TaxID=111803 RepID=A0ABP6QDV0_9ACTN
MAHLCGLCLTLRDEHGQRARLVTNYDGLIVSVLTEAQSAVLSPRRQAGACALRGFKKADVVTAQAEGARLAAAVSLLLAAGKTRDHIADGDGPYRRRAVAVAASRIARGWDRAGEATSDGIGFDASVLREAVDRQTALEMTPGLTLLELTEPTETAVAAAFAHTAVLARRPENAEPLAEAGRFFGRLAHLIDAVEDLPDDHADGAYNPLLATGTDLAEARRLASDALHGLRLALAETAFENPRLVRALLEKELGKSVDRAFEGHPYAGVAVERGGMPLLPVIGQYPPPGQYPPGQYPPPPPGEPGRKKRKRPRHRPPRPGFGPELCLSGALVGCTCGLWRPDWSEWKDASCDDRCACSRNCDGCDCSGCCDCCGMCGDGGCCDGCDCCDCGCDC